MSDHQHSLSTRYGKKRTEKDDQHLERQTHESLLNGAVFKMTSDDL